MHEQSLMKDLMNKIETIAREQSGRRVVEVTVRLGALSHISADHFREHFETSSRNTVAEGAKLNVIALDDIQDPLAQEIVLDSLEIGE